MDYRKQTQDPNQVIVDLSNLTEKLMQYQDISDDLSQEQEAKLKEESDK